MSFDVRKNRQINLQRVVKTLGISKVLELTGRQRSQLSDCAAGRRTVGEKLARSFETELGLEPGCLDLPLIEGEGLSIKPVGQRQVPLLSWLSVRSGRFDEPIDILTTDMKLSENAYALEITDIAMFPVFKPGDRVIIDPNIEPVPGDFVLAVSKDRDHAEAYFRKFRMQTQSSFCLVPLNADFPQIDGESVKVIGVMVEHRIYRK